MENQPNIITAEKSKISVNNQLPSNGFNKVEESKRRKSNTKPALNSNNNHKRERTTSESKVKKNKSKTRQNVATKVGNGAIVPPGRYGKS